MMQFRANQIITIDELNRLCDIRFVTQKRRSSCGTKLVNWREKWNAMDERIGESKNLHKKIDNVVYIMLRGAKKKKGRMPYLVPAIFGRNCTATLFSAPGISWNVPLGSNVIRWDSVEYSRDLLAYRSPRTMRSTVETLPREEWTSTRCLD